MLTIAIDRCAIRFGHDALGYYPYYFEQDDPEGIATNSVKRVLLQWAECLREREQAEVVYLPFSLDDHEVEALCARSSNPVYARSVKFESA